MTFKHKLSSRLARLWAHGALGIAMIPIVIILGCLRAVPTGSGSLARLILLPPLVSLAVNQTTDFVAFGVTTANDTVSVAVTWSATGGNITDSKSNGVHKGHFTAGGKSGKFSVVASDTATGMSDTATVMVTDTITPIASVAVLPASASAAVGGTAQFVAVPLDANGTALGGRSIAWSSANSAVASVGADGLANGLAAGTATITATSEGKSGTATFTVTASGPAPVATVVVTPASTTVFVGLTSQLTVTLRDASGNALTGRSITWASSNTAVATVNSNGLVTGVASGSANVSATSEGHADTAAITVTAPPPPPSGACLSQAGPLVTLSGLRTSTYETSSLAASTKVDATTAQFLVDQSVNVPARVGGGLGICWSGGEILGQFPPSTAWTTMHDKYGMIPGSGGSANAIRIENLTVFSYGDGISFDVQPDSGWVIRNVHIKYSRDDCIEDDFDNPGTVDSTFLDGCYDAVSAQPYSGSPNGTGKIITISNSLLRLQSMDSVYSGVVPNHNAFWKWSTTGPSLVLINNVFRADGPSKEGNGAQMWMAPPPGKLAGCQNNVMVWLGSGSYPETLPTTFNGQPCFTIMTGAAGLQYWNDAVANWQSHHPNPLPDVAPPIVSLFSPGVTGTTSLTGTVTLTATAVDDRSVSSVQFQLNGQNIGAPVTQDGASGDGVTGPTKYWISWDSRGVANGTYTLTAVARDGVGHVTTSAGVSVTVSN